MSTVLGVLEHFNKETKRLSYIVKKDLYFIVVLFMMITNLSGNQDKKENI